MFNNLKIATKLGAAFATMVVLALVVGGMAIQQMAQMYEKTHDIASSLLPSVKAMGTMGSTLNQFRRAEDDHVLALDDKTMDEVDKALARARQSLTEQLKAYEPLISGPEERKEVDDLHKALAAHFSTHAKLIPLSRGGEKTFDEAKAWLRGDSRASFYAAEAALKDIIELNDRGAAKASAEAEATYHAARAWVLALLLGMALLASGMAVVIVRTLTRQLGADTAEAAQLAASVAGGDITTASPLRSGDRPSLIAALAGAPASVANVVSSLPQNSKSAAHQKA